MHFVGPSWPEQTISEFTEREFCGLSSCPVKQRNISKSVYNGLLCIKPSATEGYLHEIASVINFQELYRVETREYNLILIHYNVSELMIRYVTTFARFKCVVHKIMGNIAGFLTLKAWLPVLLFGKLRVIVEFALLKVFNIFSFIGCKRMKRTCDFWLEILWMRFKSIQQ